MTPDKKRMLVVAAVLLGVICILCHITRRAGRRKLHDVTNAPLQVIPTIQCAGDPSPKVEAELQKQIKTYLRMALYEPFVDTKISTARMVQCVSEGQSAYSVMVCTGGAFDHVCVRFIGSKLAPHFSSVRKSFAMPHGAPPLSTSDMEYLQQLCFTAAEGSGRLPFDCKIEFGDERLVKVSIPLQEGGADSASRVLVADFKAGVLNKDYIERESDLMIPSAKVPDPPGTLPIGRGMVSGVDNRIAWDTKYLKSRAATARPAAPWDGIKYGNFYGASHPTGKPTAESRINHPMF